MGSQQFDLLPEGKKNDIFRVTFDFYTPRAHFVILAKIGCEVPQDFSQLTSFQVEKMIEAATSMMSSSDIPTGILSIHRGSWFSKKSTLHAHVCVDVEQYLDIFERRKGEIPQWPAKKYVTKQWKTNKDPRSYSENVKGYPHQGYFKEEVDAIYRTRASLGSAGQKSTSVQESSGLRVVYHPSHPKIGFVGAKMKTTEDMTQVLNVFETFAEEYGLTSRETEDDDSGCHICLYLGAGMHFLFSHG